VNFEANMLFAHLITTVKLDAQESSMHKIHVLCIFWAHASDFVTSRPFLMRLEWSAFE